MTAKAKDSRIYTSSRRIKKSIGDFHRSSRVGNPRDEYNMQQFFSEDYRGSDPDLGATITPEFAGNMLEQSLNLNNPHGLSRIEQAEEYRKKSEKRVQRLTRGRYQPVGE
jgi:hypothetical protein